MNNNKLRKKRIVCAVLSTALITNSFHAAAANGASSYKDGTYTGTAGGFLGDITVSVTVTDGSITAIDVTQKLLTYSPKLR